MPGEMHSVGVIRRFELHLAVHVEFRAMPLRQTKYRRIINYHPAFPHELLPIPIAQGMA